MHSHSELDEATLRKALSGDKAAKSVLSAHYAPHLMGLLLANGVTVKLASNCLDEIWRDVWRASFPFDTGAVISAWLENLALDYLTRRFRSAPLPAQEAEVSTTIIAAATRGDPEAFRLLTKHYSRLVYRIASRRGLPPDQCDDAFQEVMIKVMNALPRYDVTKKERFSAWLSTITHRHVTDLHRRKKHAAAPLLLEPPDPHAWTPAASELSAALRQLPPREAQVFHQHKIEQFTLEEIATATKMPLSAVFTLFDRARERLRLRLNPGPKPPPSPRRKRKSLRSPPS